jgi:hypothetical protein
MDLIDRLTELSSSAPISRRGIGREPATKQV